MKFIALAMLVQIVFVIVMTWLYVKFDGLKWQNYDDVIYWALMIIVSMPLYVKGYLALYKNKGLVVILAVVSFVLFTILSAILGLFFHTEVLKAPL